MSLIDELSTQTPLPSLDLFAVPPTQTSIERDIVREVRPLSTISSTHPIEFLIPSAYDEYINFYETYFYLTLRVDLSKTDKSAVAENDWKTVTPVNNLLHSIFEQVEVSIGDTQVNSSQNTYGYKAYLEILLQQCASTRLSILSAAGWLESEEDRRDLIKFDADDKSKGREVTLCGKLRIDLSYQPRLLLGGSQVKLKLIPQKPSFYLVSTNDAINANVTFLESFLEVHIAKVYQPIALSHDEALKVALAKLPINRREVKQFTIPKGALDSFIDNAFVGILPQTVYIVFVSNEAYHGKKDKNPFHFHHYNINYFASYFNSQQVPAKAYKPNFEKKKYIRSYICLFKTADQTCYESRIPISYKSYENNSTIFGFKYAPDLSNDCVSTGRANLVKKGTLRFEMHFDKPLPETINALVYAEFDSIVQINAERNGLMDNV